jgi:TonB-linked SusC/RagA family outer membrane protein
MKKSRLPSYAVCLLLCGLLFLPPKVNAQNAPKSTTLTEALSKVTQAFGTQFVYDPDALNGKTTIYDVSNLKNKNIEDVLKGILYPNGLVFLYVKANYYTIVPKERVGIVPETKGNEIPSTQTGAPSSPSTSKTVTGKVVSETGLAVEGASITTQKSGNGTSTGKDGKFTIKIQPNDVISISSVGYQQKDTIVPTGQTSIQITLFPGTATALDQVVVVGYGTQKRTNVTGSITSVNLETFRGVPNTNIGQALQGTVPGLNVGPVTSAGATPGISIRGRNTLNGSTSVLIILDGVQTNISLSSLNPDDIASIDVLKDASATAVYGAQAANGVLLITSKKGKGKPRLTVSSSYSTQTPSKVLHPMNRDEYLEKATLLNYRTAYLAPEYTQPNPAFNLFSVLDPVFRDGSNISTNDFDWYGEATGNGYISDNQVSLSGGSDRVNYLVSGGYTNQSGFIINDKFKRKTLRVNLEMQTTDWLKFGLQSYGSFVNQDGAEPDLEYLFRMSPLVTPYQANGELNPTPMNTVDQNPFLTYDVDDYERHNYLFANIYADVNIPFIKGLNYRINFGNNYRTDRNYGASKYGASLTGSAYKNDNQYYDYLIDNIVTYNRTFKKHGITATLLYGAINRKSDYFSASGTGFTRLTLGYNNIQQATVQTISSSGYQEALNYQMGRINYNFDSRYVVTATLRRDGFSGFAENNKYGVFPSVSGAWILTNEKFFNVAPVNSLKIRAGYGVSGNQTSRYSSLDRTSTQAAYVFGDGGTTVQGQNVSTLANPNLKWEKTYELNAGVDFTLLKNRISGSFDFYNRHTKDLLYSVSIPVVTGFSSIQTNVGEIGNKGFEISLITQNIKTAQFQWNTTVNFSRNINKIIELLGSGDLVNSGLFIGRPIGIIYNYRTDGIYQIGETTPTGYSAGNLRITDLNKDGKLTTADRDFIGSTESAYRFSVINTIKYKGITLSFLLNSIQGGKNGYLGANSPSRVLNDPTLRNNAIAGIDYWSPLNPDGRYASSILSSPLGASLYQNRSFVRLQDISLSYAFPAKWLSAARLQNMSFFVSGKNLKTWTDWEGWDPETGVGLSTTGRPVLKSYAVGLNITL